MAAADGDIASISIHSAANTRCIFTAFCFYCAARDIDDTAAVPKTAADACSVSAANCGDGAALNRNDAGLVLIKTTIVFTSTDASTLCAGAR